MEREKLPRAAFFVPAETRAEDLAHQLKPEVASLQNVMTGPWFACDMSRHLFRTWTGAVPEARSRGRAGSGLHLDVGLCLLVPLTTLAWMFETTPRSSLCPARSGTGYGGWLPSGFPTDLGKGNGYEARVVAF